MIRYLPALYDPSTSTLTFAPSTPTYLLTHTVKRLRLLAAAESEAANNFQERLKKRNDLGEAFGTRKAKSRIKAEERNKVDAKAQEGARGHMMETILEKAGRGATEGQLCLLSSERWLTRKRGESCHCLVATSDSTTQHVRYRSFRSVHSQDDHSR